MAVAARSDLLLLSSPSREKRGEEGREDLDDWTRTTRLGNRDTKGPKHSILQGAFVKPLKPIARLFDNRWGIVGRCNGKCTKFIVRKSFYCFYYINSFYSEVPFAIFVLIVRF